ncbi:similar to Saccharomyces cerevisiae YGL141W HUL5 Multiubiquitin chain assembly factor (E4) [Maudiozyma barnettii]|uniref:HECT-type E3 ubiquitin transferase n=1 Tax=Maudiozyma barnettii TaxID=61262 RepID=A0A8H2VG12_9SACH|nr:ubiquitin-ubiquitin ligase HUL5 [Kazachstania barnettii]CAB4254504.1 similar to Saccharomyces cerevisiae YGL141W HUL5 Multiubiquitin chain assembly factor (E4) [Kazachstania barnettii]CAD1782519.1 similar to Saccharomyces cerevisiae YGL141W HUL5 Multiubiquitin chain assembly factor (E4) [Kazachstania barnettii]
MLNFTGETRRRNVNLGSRSKSSKRDILLKAERDRAKRAQERKENNAVTKLQKNIRKYLDVGKYFKTQYMDSTINLMNDTLGNDVSLFPVFGYKLLYYIPINHLKRLLVKYQTYYKEYPNSLINQKIFLLLSKLPTGDILPECINIINFKLINGNEFIEIGFLPFITNNYNFDFNLTNTLPIFFSLLKLKLNVDTIRSIILPLMTLVIKDNINSLSIQTLLPIIVENELIPTMTPLDQESLRIVFNNLSFLHTIVQDKDYIENKLIEVLTYYTGINTMDNMPFYNTFNIALFESSFSKRLVSLVSTDMVPLSTLVSYINISKLTHIGYKNNLLVVLLTNKRLCEKIFNDLFKYSSIEDIRDSSINSLEIAIELLNFYLALATDSEMFSDQSSIPISSIKKFSVMLKDVVFDELWNKPRELRGKISDVAINLLTKIYIRDSRTHFCSDKSDSDFWTINDPIFVKTTIFKLIDQFNSYYKSVSDFIEPHSSSEIILSQRNLKLESLNHMIEAWLGNTPVRHINKLEILIRIPFFIHFDKRVEMFYTLIGLDKRELGIDDNSPQSFMNALMPGRLGKWTSTISRDHILEDAMDAYNNKGDLFKSSLSVKFVNEFGPEEGIDGGGVTKEFLTSVADEGFKDPKYGLFATNEQYELYPNPTGDSVTLDQLSFMGKIVGKCLYDHVLIDVDFSRFFLKKLLNYSNMFRSTFDDLNSLDSTLYQTLTRLLVIEDSQEIESLDLYFEINDSKGNIIELIPNGSTTKVNKHNILKYVLRIAEYKLDISLLEGVTAFHRGLSVMIPPIWLEMFNPEELEMLISGGKKDFDIIDLQKNTEYGGYTEDDITITNFWDIINEMTSEERCKFLKFVTSVPQAPLQGFESLDPKFGIRNAGEDLTRLPTASTCVNLLKLPDYADKETMRAKLLYSINSGARFDLS